MSDPKVIVQQLRTLSEDKDNRPFITSDDGCISGLLMFLGSDDADIALMALQTVKNLLKTPVCMEELQKKAEFLTALNLLAGGRKDTFSPAWSVVRVVALEILRYLNVKTTAAVMTDSKSKVENDSTEKITIVPMASKVNRRMSGTFSPHRTPLSPKYAAVAPAPVRSPPKKLLLSFGAAIFRDDYRRKVEGALIQLNGVVSFYIDDASGVVVVFTRRPSSELLADIATYQLEAKEVAEGFTICATPVKSASHGNKENASAGNVYSPKYLDDTPEKEKRYALARGDETSPEAKGISGWISTIAKKWW